MMSVLVWSLIVTPLLVSPPQFTCALAPSLPKSEILSILKDALETSLPQKVLVTGTLCPSQTIVHKAVTAHDTVFYILLYLVVFYISYQALMSLREEDTLFLLTTVCLVQHLIPCNSDQMDVEYRNENLRPGQKSSTSETHVKKKYGEMLLFFSAHKCIYEST